MNYIVIDQIACTCHIAAMVTFCKLLDITRTNHAVVEAFLDLKQAMAHDKDSDSATEFSADSLQFKPQVNLNMIVM